MFNLPLLTFDQSNTMMCSMYFQNITVCSNGIYFNNNTMYQQTSFNFISSNSMFISNNIYNLV